MLGTNRSILIALGALSSILLAGCAADMMRTSSAQKHYRRAKVERSVARNEEREPAKVETGSIDKAADPAKPVTSREDPRWQWCEQRHIDHQAGRAPGGATDLTKKLEDDRICAAVYERG